MKGRRIAFALATVTLLSAVPAAAQSGHGAHGNEGVVRALFDEAWSAGSYQNLVRMLAPEMQFHFRGRARAMTPAQFQEMVGFWRAAFPDLQFDVQEVVSSGDRVAARFTFTGTHRGELFGIAPTGRTVTVSMMAFFRMADGRIAEMWEDYDEHGMRQQLTRQGS